MDWDDEMLLEDQLAEYYEDFNTLRENINRSLSKKTDYELLMLALKKGPKLNKVTEHFPAFDVAEKIFHMGWAPTVKQRNAIRNVLSFFIAKSQYEEYDDEEDDEDNGMDAGWFIENF